MMKSRTLALSWLALILGFLSPHVVSYKILMVIPFASESHRNCFIPLALALAEKGDKVTILSPLPPKRIHTAIYEYEAGTNLNDFNKFDKVVTGNLALIGLLEKMLPQFSREFYNTTIVQEIYAKRKEFDIIITDEVFNEVAYPFLHDIPFIFISPPGIMGYNSATMGNPLNHAYSITQFTTYIHPMTMLERALNLFLNVAPFFYYKSYAVVPKIETELLNYFPDLPPLYEIGKNVSLILSNSHFSINEVVPLLPNQVEVGGMHCRPAKKLKKDLLTWIEESDENGVIYFSLGSIAQGTTLPLKYREIIMETFGKLKQRVIWKYEENLTDLPPNVMISNWLPQQDVLAHPKVLLFMSHGGLLSTQESIYHSTPLLVFPIFGDQPMNAKNIESKGLGRIVIWEELSVQLLTMEIEEMINNPIYQQTMNSVSETFRDKPLSAIDTAVFWTEYVIKHKGAPHLKCKGKDLSWAAFLYVDLIITLHVGAILAVFILKRIFKKIFCKTTKNIVSDRKKKN